MHKKINSKDVKTLKIWLFFLLFDKLNVCRVNFSSFCNAKCRHLKRFTLSLRQVFIRVYGLEIQSVMLVFSTQLCELLHLTPSLSE
jgi:hypothetical protein